MSHHQLGDSVKARHYYTKAVQWLEDHSALLSTPWLSGSYREEMEVFRAEAEALLGKSAAVR